MPQPTFPKQHIANGRRDIDKLAHFLARVFQAHGGGHHHLGPRIFEFNRRRAFWHLHIRCAGHDGMGVDMAGVNATLGQNIDPDIFQNQLTIIQIKLRVLGECGDMFIKRINNRLKNRKPPRQIGQGRIGRVTGEIIGLAPLIARIVILGDGIARRAQLISVDGAKRGLVEAGGEEGLNIRHIASLSQMCPPDQCDLGVHVMPVWRLFFAIASGVSVVMCIGVFISAQGGSPGPDLATIIYGFVLIMSLVGAALFAAAAVMFIMWDNRLVRFGLMAVVVLPPLILGAALIFSSVSQYLERLPQQREAAARDAKEAALEAQVRPIADSYIAQLHAPDFAADDLAALRTDFQDQMRASDIRQWRSTNAAFYLGVHADLYEYVITTPSIPEPEGTIGSGLLHDAACFEFSNVFRAGFTDAQASTFDVYCPAWKIEQGPRAMEIVR